MLLLLICCISSIPPSHAAAAAIVHVGGAEGRGELADQDGDAQLPASRTLGQRSA
jgi:hypothetical protein